MLPARLTHIVLASLLLLSPTHASDVLYKSDPGSWSTKVFNEDWHDTKRNRDVPVRIYLPQSKDGSDKSHRPVIIFSPGWGASRINYGYFCEHLASEGYLVITITHIGSDTASVPFIGKSEDDSDPSKRPLQRLRDRISSGPNESEKEGLKKSVDDPNNLRNRPLDISFVIDQLSIDSAVKEIADPDHIGLAGHSFGADTAMAIGGMLVDLPEGKHISQREPRVKAVLPMSPEGVGTMGISPGAWDKFAVPVLFLTGTRDYGSGEKAAAWRRMPFEAVHGVDHYLVTITDATHFTFAMPEHPINGILAGKNTGPAPADAAPLIDSLGTAFFDAELLNNTDATAWLKTYFSEKHDNCTAEFKAAH